MTYSKGTAWRNVSALVVLTAASALAFTLLPSACLDVTPLFVAPKDASTGVPEASCSGCVTRPSEEGGCGADIDKCRQDPACGPVYACTERFACLDKPGIDDKLQCALPCLIDAGITTIEDPVVQLLLGVVRCGQERCAIPCNLGDSGPLI
jgi:hypothetical protein